MSTDLPNPSTTDLHDELSRATSALLGATMGLSDEQWREPSLLPGWTRGHVGAHLALNADALRRVVEGVLNNEPVPMYGSAAIRDHDIEQSAAKPGLELQTDLDTTATQFANTIDGRNEDERHLLVELRNGLELPLGKVAINRLSEVVLHHVDLGTGFSLADASEASLDWLLQFWAFRLHRREDFPALLLDTGEREYEIGSRGWGTDYRRLSGTSLQLLGWITGRSDGGEIDGAAEIHLPPLA